MLASPEDTFFISPFACLIKSSAFSFMPQATPSTSSLENKIFTFLPYSQSYSAKCDKTFFMLGQLTACTNAFLQHIAHSFILAFLQISPSEMGASKTFGVFWRHNVYAYSHNRLGYFAVFGLCLAQNAAKFFVVKINIVGPFNLQICAESIF